MNNTTTADDLTDMDYNELHDLYTELTGAVAVDTFSFPDLAWMVENALRANNWLFAR